ncbi:MAG: UDP-3-O-(3-hydroxymyristoyl)glucosamine N-acyltransferase [Pseudomonadota bacterium]
MADPRFFERRGPFSLEFLANAVGGDLDAGTDRGMMLADVAPLDRAGRDDISFFEDKRRAASFADTGAGACLVGRGDPPSAPPALSLVRVDKPYRAFIKLANLFYPEPAVAPGIDPRAMVDASASLGAGCRIEAGAVIGPRAEIGARCLVGALTVIGPGCVLGPDCRIDAGVTISHAVIGARVRLAPGVRIGQPGFGFVPNGAGFERVPQLGRVIIHDDADIGANTTVDRGVSGDTVIGTGCIIDNLVQIAHNVTLGQGCIIVAQAGIAGSTTLEDHVVIGGQAALRDHLKIGKGARVAAKGGVMRDIEPGVEVGGAPAVPIRQFHRQTVALARLATRKGD